MSQEPKLPTEPIKPGDLDARKLTHRRYYSDDALPKYDPNFQELKGPEPEPVSVWKKIVSHFILLLILAGIWSVGQVSIGIPDELALQFLTILLYNWFADNGYKLPAWLPKLLKK